MSAVPHAQYQKVLSEIKDQMPKRAMVVGPTLLQSRNNEADHKKMVGVSRGATPY